MKIIRWSATYDEVFDYPRPIYRNSRDILKQIAAEFEVSMDDIISRDKHQSIVKIRYEFFYRAMKLPNMSVTKLARIYGFNHTTVAHGVEKVGRDKNKGYLSVADLEKKRASAKVRYERAMAALNTLDPSQY